MPAKQRRRELIVGGVLSVTGLSLLVCAAVLVVRSGLGRPIATSSAIFVGFTLGGPGVLVLRRKLSLMHLCFLGIIGLACLLVLEASFRTVLTIRKEVKGQARAYSDGLGWVTLPDQELAFEIPGYGPVHYTTARDGFRVFGDPASDKLRVLFIGDSYTEALHVSDGKAYYSRLSELNPGIEVFAYGCGGYGTLQEYMVLDRMWDLIRPQLVVLQFCSNDFINNDHALESASESNNNHMTRPYLEDDRVVMKYPHPNYGPLYKLVQHSAILRFLRVEADWLKTRRERVVEAELRPGHPGLQRSAETTSRVLRLVCQRAAGTPVALFPTDETEWSGPLIRRIAEYHSIHYIDSVTSATAQAKRKGEVIDGSPADMHWNAAGHDLVAHALNNSLRKLGLIPE